MVEEEALQVGEGSSDHGGDLGVEVTATWHRMQADENLANKVNVSQVSLPMSSWYAPPWTPVMGQHAC